MAPLPRPALQRRVALFHMHAFTLRAAMDAPDIVRARNFVYRVYTEFDNIFIPEFNDGLFRMHIISALAAEPS
jgi:hypothetical protein